MTAVLEALQTATPRPRVIHKILNLLPHSTAGETRALRVSHCICGGAAPFHRPGCPFETLERRI